MQAPNECQSSTFGPCQCACLIQQLLQAVEQRGLLMSASYGFWYGVLTLCVLLSISVGWNMPAVQQLP